MAVITARQTGANIEALSRVGRIALIVPAFPKLSETFIVSKFLGLLDKGWDVRIVCSTSDEAEWRRFPQLLSRTDVRQRVVVAPPVKPRWLVPVRMALLLLRSLIQRPAATTRYMAQGWKRFGVRVLKHFYLDANLILAQPDVVHFEFGALAVNRMYLRDLLGCKIVVSFRGYDLNFSGLDQAGYYDDVWAYADHIHCLGYDLWQRALRRGCPPEKPHTLIAPAIDIDRFSPAEREIAQNIGTPDRPLRLLSVGRLEWKKGYEYGLQAVKLLRESGLEVEYRIIGSGHYLDAIAFCRHQLGLEDCVHFLGPQPQSVVLDNMRWADIFMHAAVTEGFCNAVIEAQAMKLPVVTSDAGGLGENVIDGCTGFVVPRRNPHALAEKVRILAESPELRAKMGEAGRNHVIEHFAIERQIEAFSNLYKQVL